MKNRILRGLPPKEYRLLASHLKPLELPQGRVLYEPGQARQEVYFPEEAALSYFSGTAGGEMLEVCIVGREGFAGIASLFGEQTAFRAVVQLPGRAYSIRREVLYEEFRRCEGLQRLLLQYTNALLVQIAQTAVCNKFHSISERFCRWLLMAFDRSGSNHIPLTQEALARVLGTRRASVSVVAGHVENQGAIRCSRGAIEILDRKYLEAASCECYEAISAAFANIDY